jgi:serine protease Do
MFSQSHFSAALTASAIGVSAAGILACDDTGKPVSDRDQEESRLEAAIKRVRPGVVLIQGNGKREGLDAPKKPAGVGFVVDREGVIVTGSHVIDGMDSIEVVLHDGRKLAAQAVVSDTRTELAIIRVQTNQRLALPHLADSADVRLGDTVLTLGTPFGLGITVSKALISATCRTSKHGAKVFQMDSAISPGGPTAVVVNLAGEVIGLGIPGPGPGIWSAIPSNRVKEIYAKLAEKKASSAECMGRFWLR